MFRILLKKYLQESWLLWLCCALVLFFFPWVRLWTVSQFELSGFEPILKQFRSFEKFSPVPLEQFLTYRGMVAFTFDEPVLLLCVLVWSIARGSDVVSGELNRGTMELLLAQPVSRSKVFLAHTTVTVVGLMLLSILVYAGLKLGIETNSTPVTRRTLVIPYTDIQLNAPFEIGGLTKLTTEWVPLHQFVDPSLYVLPTLNLFALGYAVLGLSVFLSARDQYRWRTIGVVIGIYVLQLLLFILSKSTPRLHWLTPFSFLAAYQPDWIVQRLSQESEAGYRWIGPGASNKSGMEYLMSRCEPLGFIMILLTLGTVAHVLAWRRFCCRDLPAPQ
jgi:ABC-2 type transport system permease protein